MGKIRGEAVRAGAESSSDLEPARPLKVLLVEDNTADVFLFQGALPDIPMKIDVQVAEDAEKALVLLSDPSYECDLVILDLNLPRLWGYQVLERYTRKKVPVVVFTSSRSAVDARSALSLGAREVFQKPNELQPYRDMVRSIIEKWTRRT